MSVADKTPVQKFKRFGGRVLDEDPFAAWLPYREMDPFWAEGDDVTPTGSWVVTRFDQVREVMQNPKTFSHADRFSDDMVLMPSFFDPPEQLKQRSVILPLMTAAKIDPLKPQMHAVCRELIATFKDRGHCNAVSEFAQRYPIKIFGDLYGLEEDRRQEFRVLAETWLHDLSRQQEAWTAIREIMSQELQKRREHPQDDMLNGIAHAQYDGELISIDTAANLASTVFLGGLDTLPSNMAWTLRYLTDHPDLRHRLATDPECISRAVEEFFRVFPVVAGGNSGARAQRDVEFHGVDIKAGDRVTCLINLANLDSSVFGDPLHVDFDRQSNRHMAFSAGSHRCLGSHLARHEMGVFLQEWHAAIPDYRIVDPDAISFTGGAVLAIRSLPLEWDV
jgi:cytochrome P450